MAPRPEGAMLLYHLGQQHLAEAAPYMQRMATECIGALLPAGLPVAKRPEGRHGAAQMTATWCIRRQC
jgi:hypothetical protein